MIYVDLFKSSAVAKMLVWMDQQKHKLKREHKIPENKKKTWILYLLRKKVMINIHADMKL